MSVQDLFIFAFRTNIDFVHACKRQHLRVIDPAEVPRLIT